MPWRHLLDQGAYPADDAAGSIAVFNDGIDDGIEGLPDLFQIRGVAAKPAQSGIGAGDCRGYRLADLMGDRGRELPHRRDAIGVRELHLRFAVSRFPFLEIAYSSARSPLAPPAVPGSRVDPG